MRFTFQFLLCVGLGVGSLSAQAAIILDDFDDSAETVSPEMLNDTIFTTNVGGLSATRELRIAASTSGERASIASLDTGVTVPGAMTANLQKVGSVQGGGSPLFAFQFNYLFSPTDVSQRGTNDAILLDFRSINGTEPPIFVRTIVTDDAHRTRFEARVYNPLSSSSAFTIAMPFSSFTVRGGSPGLPDFTTFKQMDFDFFFLRPSLDIQWTARLERIRFGRIPEPTAWMLMLGGIIILASQRVSFPVLATACLVLCLNSQSAQAAIILDDFDDPAQVASPEMEGIPTITQNVGALNARRRLEIDALQADPIATLDASITVESRLTGTMSDLMPSFVNGSPRATLQLWYDQFQSDFTGNGVNNTLFIDVTTIEGPTPPAFLRVLVQEATHPRSSFFTVVSSLEETSTPVVLALPFDSFVSRGGGLESADFRTIRLIKIEFFANGFFGEPEELGWTIELDSIRVGAIPEPSSASLFVLGISFLLSRQRWR